MLFLHVIEPFFNEWPNASEMNELQSSQNSLLSPFYRAADSKKNNDFYDAVSWQVSVEILLLCLLPWIKKWMQRSIELIESNLLSNNTVLVVTEIFERPQT